MRQRIDQLNKKVHSILGKREGWMEEREKLVEENKILFQNIRWGKGAHQIAVLVGESLQAQISQRLSSIASYLLDCIFPDPLQVKLHFSSSGRGKGNIEALILFSQNGEEFKPVLPSGQFLTGGGPIEVGAFGLRCGIWAQTASSSSRPIFFLDEPFRFIQKDLQSLVAETLNALSEKMGIQIILVTHEPDIAMTADNIIQVGGKDGRKSNVTPGNTSNPCEDDSGEFRRSRTPKNNQNASRSGKRT